MSEPSFDLTKTYDWLYLATDLYIYTPKGRYICQHSAWYRGNGTVYSTSSVPCKLG